ncbi:MAG: TerB family tellurite resistance protein [Bacteroidota bacterium]|jgi:DnaJ like chaperone protein
MRILKWLAGGIGWAIGGPIGGVIGFALGTIADGTRVSVGTSSGSRARTLPGDFTVSLLVLSAAVMKADGRTLRSELDYVREFLKRNLGEEKSKELIPILGEILKKDIPLYEVCSQIKDHMNYEGRLQLLHYLYGIALSDGGIHSSEINVIENIASYLSIDNSDRDSIRAMYYRDTDADYKILEIEPSATDEEVKKAYRKMAVKYHPDKVEGLGDEVKKSAEEKFKRLQEAYDNIKKTRGLH